MTQHHNKLEERAFSFLPINNRRRRPRQQGLTEIRGPYYTPVGKIYLSDLLDAMGAYVDSFKYAGGSFSLMPQQVVRELITCAIATTSWCPPEALSSGY
jgi:phosphosulfolactate synthase (CoM biosynthesis protein A)